MDDPSFVETDLYDELTGQVVTKTTFQNAPVLEANKAQRLQRPEMQKYKGNLVKVGSIHMGDIIRLKSIGHDILSNNPDEVRRALCYVQENEPALLTVTGKPFARHRNTWA